MTQITCLGEVVTETDGSPLCQDEMGAPLAWTASPAFSIDALDPVLLSGAFAAGFTIVATGWVIGYGVKTVLKMLK